MAQRYQRLDVGVVVALRFGAFEIGADLFLKRGQDCLTAMDLELVLLMVGKPKSSVGAEENKKKLSCSGVAASTTRPHWLLLTS